MKLKFCQLKLENRIKYLDNKGIEWEYFTNIEAFRNSNKGNLTTCYTDKKLIEEITFEECVVLSEVERIILENISGMYNFIVRNRNGNLLLFEKEPEKFGGEWRERNGFVTQFSAFKHLFQMVQYEDERATSIFSLIDSDFEIQILKI